MSPQRDIVETENESFASRTEPDSPLRATCENIARGFEILTELGKILSHWMLGQPIDMSVVGALAALGLLAGFLTFAPYLGAILAGIWSKAI